MASNFVAFIKVLYQLSLFTVSNRNMSMNVFNYKDVEEILCRLISILIITQRLDVFNNTATQRLS
jgi:hypothetical protein